MAVGHAGCRPSPARDARTFLFSFSLHGQPHPRFRSLDSQLILLLRLSVTSTTTYSPDARHHDPPSGRTNRCVPCSRRSSSTGAFPVSAARRSVFTSTRPIDNRSYGTRPNERVTSQPCRAKCSNTSRSLKSTGKGACILPHGVLFRGNAEAVIRTELVRSGYLKGIIGLPANLFYGTRSSPPSACGSSRSTACRRRSSASTSSTCSPTPRAVLNWRACALPLLR